MNEQKYFCDVLVRLKPVGMSGPDYEILTVSSRNPRGFGYQARMAVNLMNTKEGERFREIVCYGNTGDFEEWVENRGPYEEWWGDYQS